MDPATLAAARDLVARLQLFPPAVPFIPAASLRLIPNYKAYIAPSTPLAVEDVAKRLARAATYPSFADLLADLRRVFTNATRLNWRCTEPYRRSALQALNWIDDAVAGSPLLASALAAVFGGRPLRSVDAFPEARACRAALEGLLAAPPGGEVERAEKLVSFISPPAVYAPPPDYFSRVPNPVCIADVCEALYVLPCRYPDAATFRLHVNTIFDNAVRYWGPASPAGVKALALREEFEALLDVKLRELNSWLAGNGGVEGLRRIGAGEELIGELGAPMPPEMVRPLPDWARAPPPAAAAPAAAAPAPVAAAPVAAPVASLAAAPAAPSAAAAASPAPPVRPDVPVHIPPLTPLGEELEAAASGGAPAPSWATMTTTAAKACLALLTSLRKETFISVATGQPTPITPAFEHEIDRFALPHYYLKIKEPRCLTGIEKRLQASAGSSRARAVLPYTSLTEFHTDMELITANCLAFNTDAASADYRFLARTFSAAYRRGLGPLLETLAAPPASRGASGVGEAAEGGAGRSAKGSLAASAAASGGAELPPPVVAAPAPAPAASTGGGGGGGFGGLKLKLKIGGGGGGGAAAAPAPAPAVIDLPGNERGAAAAAAPSMLLPEEPSYGAAAAAPMHPAPAPAPRLSLSMRAPPKPKRTGPGLLPGEELPFTEEEIAAADDFKALVLSETPAQQLVRARHLAEPTSLGDLWLWDLDALAPFVASATGGAAAGGAAGGSKSGRLRDKERERAQAARASELSAAEQEALTLTLSRPPYLGWAPHRERVVAATNDVIKRLWDNEWGGAVPAFRCGWLDYDSVRPEFRYRDRFEAHPLVQAGKMQAYGLVDLAIQVEVSVAPERGGGGQGRDRGGGGGGGGSRVRRVIAVHPDFLNVKEVVEAVETFFRVTLDLHMSTAPGSAGGGGAGAAAGGGLPAAALAAAAAAAASSAGGGAAATDDVSASSSSSSFVSPDPKWDLDVTCRASHALRYFQFLVSDRFAELLPALYAAQATEHNAERETFLLPQPVVPAGAPALAEKASRALEKILKALSSEHASNPAAAHNKHFLKPVQLLWAVLPADYDAIVPVRMDLSTVRDRLAVGAYRTFGEVLSDLHLTFDNAIRYNSRVAGQSAASQEIVAAAQWMKSELTRLWGAASLDLWEAYHRWHVEGQVTAQMAEAAKRVREEAERRRGEQVAAMEAARDASERRELMRQLLAGLSDGRPLPLDLAVLLTPTKEAVADLVLAQALRPGSGFYPDHELASALVEKEMPRIAARRAVQLVAAAAAAATGSGQQGEEDEEVVVLSAPRLAPPTAAAVVLQEGTGAVAAAAPAAGSKRRRRRSGVGEDGVASGAGSASEAEDRDGADEEGDEGEDGDEAVQLAPEAKRRRVSEVPAALPAAAAAAAPAASTIGGSFVTLEADGVVLSGSVLPPRRTLGLGFSGGAASRVGSNSGPVRVALKASAAARGPRRPGGGDGRGAWASAARGEDE